MAWNQPGGSGGGGRDPWGGGGGAGGGGPPDLDEILRKLQAQLRRFFSGVAGGARSGGGDGEGGGGGGGGFSLGAGGTIGIGVIVAVVVAVWVLSGIYIVDPPERAVVLRFGEHVRTEMPGPRWHPRFIERVEKINVQAIRNQDIGFRRAPAGSQSAVLHESLMLTEDENIVDVKFTVQYRVADAAKFLFNVLEPELTLRQAVESALREIVGRSGMDFVITEGRSVVSQEAGALAQEIVDRYESGMHITSSNMQDAQPPGQVQDAFFDAIKAREDQIRTINEANAYRAEIVPKARGDATAILERAEGYRQRVIAASQGETARFLQVLGEYRKAPEVTRDRLYIETVESVLANSSKVLINVESGNSLMYLPIDRLLATDRDDTIGMRPDAMRDPGARDTRLGIDESRRARDALGGRTR